MSGISDRALQFGKYNKYRFNGGNEEQAHEFSDGSGLELYDANFRLYDAQIGRFHQADPLADIFEDQSPYSFGLNNPILLNDPLGLAVDSVPNPDHIPYMSPVVINGGPKPKTPSDCIPCGATDNGSGSNNAFIYSPTPAPAPSPAPTTPVEPPSPMPEIGVGTGVTGAEEIGTIGGGAAIGLGTVFGTIVGVLIPIPTGKEPNLSPRPRWPVLTPGPSGTPDRKDGRVEEQYALTARQDGLYPRLLRGKGVIIYQWLQKGEVWKFGTTVNGRGRYSEMFYSMTGAGLDYAPEFKGTPAEVIAVQNAKIINYIIAHFGQSPPGNPVTF